MKTYFSSGIPFKLWQAVFAFFWVLTSNLSASTDYGPAIWYPTCDGHWYTSGYGKKFFVVHDMEGYYLTGLSYLAKCTTQASIHYCANGKVDYAGDAPEGEIAQMVRDSYYAWHARCWNLHSMGTEHEGFAGNPAWFTEAMYQSSAALTRSKADKYGFAKDRNHIVAHGQKLVAGWPAWASANLGIDPYCNDHTDPGPYWDWNHYMALIANQSQPLAPAKTRQAAILLDDGRQMVFAIMNGTAFYNMQVVPNGGWSGWQAIGGGGIDSIVAGKNADGRPQAFCVAGNVPWMQWQNVDGTWSGWVNMGGNVTSIGVGRNPDGRLELFGVGTDTIMYHNWQTAPNAGWSGWFSLGGGYLTSATVANNADGRLEVFSINMNREPFHIWQTASGWSAWTSLGGGVNALAVGRNADGRLELFGAGTDTAIWHTWQGSPNGGWGGWVSMGGLYMVDVKVASNADGRLEAFCLGLNGHVYNQWQTAANGGWNGTWADLGGTVNSLEAGRNQSGTLEIYGFASDNALWHQWQGSPWSGWWSFGALAQAPLMNASMALSITAPGTVNAGDQFTATVVMKNSGSKPWSSSGANAHKLGSQNPQDNTTWGLSRVALPSATINPSQTATFTFTATAPASAGSYAFEWKMLQEGIEWFGQAATMTITVVNPGPAAPSALSGTPVSSAQINLSWVDNSSNETGFKVERSTDNVNFSQIGTTAANITSYQAGGLSPNTTYYFRVRSYNGGGNSAYSNTATVATPRTPPDLASIGNKTVSANTQLSFSVTSTDPNKSVSTVAFQDFEAFTNYTTDDQFMFRKPMNSSSTTGFVDTTLTNFTKVATSFPAGHASAKVLRSSWSFKTGTTNPWMRLTTANTANMPNPTVDLDQVVRFDICVDKTMNVAIGLRETATTAAIGANGGTSGTIDWAGVSSVTGGMPNPTRSLAANAWTTLSFNVPFDAQAAFSGDGVISSGIKGVLEHLALIPTGGMGAYNVYLDNFAVITTNTLSFSLDGGAPAGASIHPKTGVFKWTPTSGQAPNTYTITIRVTDQFGLTDYETIVVSVLAGGNTPPVLVAIGNRTIDEGANLSFTATATDADAGQTRTFSLDAGAPAGASINSSTGVFSWTPSEAQGPGSYPITVRVTDNGSPASNDWETIAVTVNEVNSAPVLAAISDRTIAELSSLNLTATANDSDAPANVLTYSLVTAPAGMTINSASRAIAWTPTEAAGPGTYTVTVKATDNGTPAASDSKSFAVTVTEANVAPVLSVNTTVAKVDLVSDFETAQDNSYNGTILFRQPAFSATTSGFLDSAVSNSTVVTSAIPLGNTSTRVLWASWSFKTGMTNPWLRLSTYNTAVQPNPAVSFLQHLKIDVYCDKEVKVGLGLRETGTGAVIGQNGGTTGTIEWIGVDGLNGSTPNPTRTVAAGSWTTLDFYMPTESITAFTGDGVLTSPTGKGVLESLAIIPAGGTGVYNLYLDNLQVVTVTTNLTVDTGSTLTLTNVTATDSDSPAQTLTYSVDAGAPTNLIVNPQTGAITWTPASWQGPSTNQITLRVTDDGPGNLSDTETLTIIVNKVNTAPHLTGVPDQAVEINGGGVINVTITATDDDVPTNTLSFSLQGTPPSGATINPTTGVFTWTPPNQLSTNIITVRVTDNGVPALYDEKDMTIVVVPTNTAPVLALGNVRLTEKVVNFESFTNNTANGTVMFRRPNYSGSTTAFLDTSTNYTTVTTAFPAGNPNASSKVLKAGFGFATGKTGPWLRLVTTSAANVPNPTVDLTARVKFDIYADKSIKVALGVRETGTTAAIGGDGGTTGGVEWLGATKVGTSPDPSRIVSAGTWTTVEFNLPAEYCTNFSGGNSVLAGGKGVLEHLAIVPNGGMGAYVVYVDNFEVIWTPTLPGTVNMNANATLSFTASATDPDPGSGISFGLDADAPSGASIDPVTGAFSWTPITAASSTITVFANDNPVNGASVKTDTETFTAVVSADPVGVRSTPPTDAVAYAGEVVTLRWVATPGAQYQVQFKENIDSEWIDFGDPILATERELTVEIAEAEQEAVYRVIDLGAFTPNE